MATDWPRTSCPDWCQEDHALQLHPDDRRHMSRSFLVPAVVRRVTPGTDDQPRRVSLEAEELGIVLHQDEAEHAIWVAIASEFQSLEVSLESGSRLSAALIEALDLSGSGGVLG